MINLETRCAECAKEIVELVGNDKKKARDWENKLRNATGILAEDGFYAFFIFLRYRELNQPWDKLAKFLSARKVKSFAGDLKVDENSVIEVTESFERLLFTKDMIRQVLIYALYGLRAVR